MKKILPMTYPPVTAYHYHADLLSVLLSYEECRTWLYNNYIQLEFPQLGGNGEVFDGRLDFFFPYSVWKSCPFLYYQRISRSLIRVKWGSIIDFICDSINCGYYVYFDIDRFYIPGTYSYQKRHHTHDLFVYGYDNENQTIYITDYPIGGKYTYKAVSYQELEEAYQKQPQVNNCWQGEGVELISYFPRKHSLNIPYIKRSIQDYLESTTTITRCVPDDIWRGHKERLAYGYACYDHIRFFLKTYLPTHNIFETRLLSVFYEHKRLMAKRIDYLSQQGYLLDAGYIATQYCEIEQRAAVAQSLLLKYYVRREECILNRVLEQVEWIEKKERPLLSYLINNILDEPLPKCIKRLIPVYPAAHVCTTVKKVGQSFDLPPHPPLNPDKVLTWFSTTPGFIVEKNPFGGVNARAIRGGSSLYQGFDDEGNLRAICSFTCAEPGFQTNIVPTVCFSGTWIEDSDGLIGFASREGIQLSEASFTDGKLEADILLAEGTAVALIARANSTLSEFCCVVLDSQGLLKLWEATGDTCKVEMDIPIGHYQHLTVLMMGSNIDVLVDGRLKLHYTSVSLLAGHIGLRIIAGAAKFQNVKITGLGGNLPRDFENDDR